MPKAAILGCGPAALFAAYACQLSGIDVQLYSRDGASRLYGAQFLGKALPYLHPSTPTQDVQVSLQGTEDEYRHKVYGPDYTGPVSPNEYVGNHVVYDIRHAYSTLWERYCSRLDQFTFDPGNYSSATKTMLESFDFVFSTLPLRDLCVVRDHNFFSRTIFAVGDAPDLGVRCPVRVPEGQIIYCGNRNASWYRASNIFGHCTVEWSKKPPISGVATVTKPLGTDCTCFPEVVRLGRYGEWRKGVLAVDAFNKAMNTVRNGVQSVLF